MTEHLREILRSTLFRRVVLGLYVALLALTIGAYIGVSLLDVRTAAYFRGGNILEKGQPNAVRGVILNARTGRYRRDVAIDFVLSKTGEGEDPERADDPDGSETRIGSARPDAEGVVRTSLTVPPDIEPGTYRLGLRADGPAIEPFRASTEVEVARASEDEGLWPSHVTRIADEERRERFEGGPVIEQSGSLAVGVLPPDGEVPRGLPGSVYLVTYDAETGEPVPATVTFDKVEGLGQWGGQTEAPSQIRTDAMGLAPIAMEPVGGQKWTVSVEEALDSEDGAGREGSATIEIHTVASKMSLSLEQPYARHGGEVSGQLHSLFRSGALNVDLYRGTRWRKAVGAPVGRERRAQFALELPKQSGAEPWLYRIQTSRGVYGTGNAWDIAHVVVPPGSGKSGMRRGLGRLVSLIAEHRDEHAYFQHLADQERVSSVTAGRTELTEWTEAFLRALPRHFSRPATLFNTQKGDRAALRGWIDRVQADLMIPIVIALIGGLAVLLYIAVGAWRRKREHERHLREIDDDLAADAEAAGEVPEEADAEVAVGAGGDLLAWLLAVVALAVMAMFGLGLLLLLSYL